MKRFPIIANKVSFKEFRELCLIHKFSRNSGFVLLYGYGKSGYQYRILLKGGNQLKALRAAYFLLFGNTDEYEKDVVSVSDTNTFKMPLSVNFGFAYRTECFDADWFKTCMSSKLNLVD